MTKNFLLKIINAFSEDRVIGGICSFYPDDGNFIDRLLFKLGNLLSFLLLKTSFCYAPAFCFFLKRKIFQKEKGFREDLEYCEDNDLAKRCKKHGNFIYLNCPVFVSLRRFKKRGYVLSFFEYITSTIYYFVRKKVPSTKFKLEPVR